RVDQFGSGRHSVTARPCAAGGGADDQAHPEVTVVDSDKAVLPDAQPRVAVVVVTYNSASVLGGCLDSLVDQGVRISSVVVADNASHDDPVAVAREATHLPIRTVQLGRNAGYAAAVNAGIAAVRLDEVDAVFVMNPDCRLRPGALRLLAGALQQPGRGIAIP